MMKSLRKDTGGYALLYVMVIVFVLCAISMTICTVALRNLQSQEASVKRMEEKYAAEGEIEKIKAKLEALSVTINKPVSADALTAFETEIEGLSDAADAEIVASCDEDGTATVTVSSGNSTKVIAELAVDFEIVTNYEEHVPPATESVVTGYTFSTNSVSFTSYTIENTGGGT